jgi:hypothetical protein
MMRCHAREFVEQIAAWDLCTVSSLHLCAASEVDAPSAAPLRIAQTNACQNLYISPLRNSMYMKACREWRSMDSGTLELILRVNWKADA